MQNLQEVSTRSFTQTLQQVLQQAKMKQVHHQHHSQQNHSGNSALLYLKNFSLAVLQFGIMVSHGIKIRQRTHSRMNLHSLNFGKAHLLKMQMILSVKRVRIDAQSFLTSLQGFMIFRHQELLLLI